MAKYLRLNPDTRPDGALGGVNYRLPAETNLAELAEQVELAINGNEALTVTVELADDPRGRATVVINADSIESVLLGETPEPG